MNIDQIREVATKVRTSLVDTFGIPSCGGLCAIGSVWVAKELKSLGYEVKVHMASSAPGEHCFVVVGNDDPVIVDCTATQFSSSHEDVVIMDYRKALVAKWYWRTKREYDPSKTRTALKRMGWPTWQLPQRKANLQLP